MIHFLKRVQNSPPGMSMDLVREMVAQGRQKPHGHEENGQAQHGQQYERKLPAEAGAQV